MPCLRTFLVAKWYHIATIKGNSMAMTLRLPAHVQAEAQDLAQYLGISLNGLCIMALRNFVTYQNKSRAVPKGAAVLPAAGTVAMPSPSPVPCSVPKVGPNERCPCDSGLKYKRCHGKP